MSYVTPADVRTVLAGSENLAGTAAGLSDADLQASIDEAQQEVDGRLANRYAVPFADGSVPPVVANVTRDIAAWLATLTYRRGDPIATGEPVQLRYNRAETLLGQLASGAVLLDITPEPAATSPVATANLYDGDLFTPDDFGVGTLPPSWASSWPGGYRGW